MRNFIAGLRQATPPSIRKIIPAIVKSSLRSYLSSKSSTRGAKRSAGGKAKVMLPKRIGESDIAEIQFGRMRRYLEKKGWMASAVQRRPVGKKGAPIPWYTYACAHFLESRVTPDLDVFEYGSGHSTLWWARCARSVTSLEHDRAFFEEIGASLPSNVTYLYHDVASNGPYDSVVKAQGRAFDIIVVDGEDRVRCAIAGTEALSEAGVIVWDNADRSRYQEGYDFLHSKGFRRLDFRSHGPIWIKEWSTAIFYRRDNCLGI